MCELLGNAAMKAFLGFLCCRVCPILGLSAAFAGWRLGGASLLLVLCGVVAGFHKGEVCVNCGEVQSETRMWAAAWQVRRTPSSAWLSGQCV